MATGVYMMNGFKLMCSEYDQGIKGVEILLSGVEYFNWQYENLLSYKRVVEVS